MGGEFDLLVPPLGRPVHAGDDAHPVDAPEVPVDKRVSGLGLVCRTVGEPEMPLGILLPRVLLQVGVLVAGAGLDLSPVAVGQVLTLSMRCSAYTTASGLIEYEAITAFFPGRGYQALSWGRRMITGPPVRPGRAGLRGSRRLRDPGRGSLVTGPGRALLKRGNPGPRHQPGSPYPVGHVWPGRGERHRAAAHPGIAGLRHRLVQPAQLAASRRSTTTTRRSRAS